MRFKSIVIEDEPLALRKLISFIDKIDYLEVTKTFDNAVEAVGFLKNNPVDLIFLDIQMEEFTGIQFLEAIHQCPKVIITTAYDKYALKGYEFSVVDYLLKPYTFDRFVRAVDKVFNTKLEDQRLSSSDSVFIKTEYRLEKVRLPDILYIEGMSEYLKVVTVNKKILTKQNFRNMEEILPQGNFVRVHKSYMVAIDKIESIEKNRIKINDLYIPISDSYRDTFYSKIGISKQK
jgi:two-component system, LytTR family, response regulator